MSSIRQIISRLFGGSSPTIWTSIVVAISALFASVFFSEAQESYGIWNVLISLTFLLALFFEIMMIYRAYLFDSLKQLVFPRIEMAMSQQPPDDRYDHLFDEYIISDRKLSEFERNCMCDEIWIASNDLTTEIDGGLYAEIVPYNLSRGIKYKFFAPRNNITVMRMEHLKRRDGSSENVKYYLLSDDFFFLVPRLDFTIYNPYGTSATGRIGYIGLDLPDSEDLYAAKVDDLLTDAIASKLLEYIRNNNSD